MSRVREKLLWVDMEIARIKLDPDDSVFDFETARPSSSAASCGGGEAAKTAAQGSCGSCSHGCH